jgi:hypothetical protein
MSDLDCPYCELAICVQDYDTPELYGEGESEVRCPNCGNQFILTTWHTPQFEGAKIEEKDNGEKD